MPGPHYDRLKAAAHLRQRARQYADSALPLAGLLVGIGVAQEHEFEGEAWALREAIAIRIVDHPNEVKEGARGERRTPLHEVRE